MKTVKISKLSTKPSSKLDKKKAKKETKELVKRIAELQRVMYAEQKHSILVVLQGMDASGKDGATRNVFGRVNPAGCRVHSFKKPTDLEFAHDFLWRAHKVAPADGMIQIFNRSHYEDVLIQRVHKWIDMKTVHQRFEHINNFEKLLQANGTHVLKFFLNVSQDEQLVRLNERKTMPHKFWKHNDNDFKEREHWDKYMEAYEDCFKYCSPDIPWTIVPSDDNWGKEYTIAKTVVDLMESLDMEYPPLKEG